MGPRSSRRLPVLMLGLIPWAWDIGPKTECGRDKDQYKYFIPLTGVHGRVLVLFRCLLVRVSRPLRPRRAGRALLSEKLGVRAAMRDSTGMKSIDLATPLVHTAALNKPTACPLEQSIAR